MAIIASTGKLRNKIESLWRVADAAWFGRDVSTFDQAPDLLNGEYTQAVNAAGTGTVSLIGLDSSNTVQIPGPVNISNLTLNNPAITEINNQFINPTMQKTATFDLQNNGSLGTQTFFIADRAYTITGVSYVAKTQGTGTAVASVTHETGTQAPGAGSAIQTGTFACTTIVNATTTPGVLTATTANLNLVAGDRLSVLFTGTTTTLAGVVITVTMTPSSASETAMYFCNINADIATTSFYQANRDMVITGIKVVYLTPFIAAATLNITKDTGTTAAGAGTATTAAAVALDGTANTVLSPALTATAATLSMAAGDRLSVKFSATTTGVGIAVLVSFAPIYNRMEISWQLALNAQQQITQYFFIADRAYEVIDASCVFDVTAGGAAKLGVTIDKGTTAPGSGNVIQTDNASAGFDMNATARTTQFMTPASLHLRLLSAGDRLGLKVSGAAQSISLVTITCSLRPQY